MKFDKEEILKEAKERWKDSRAGMSSWREEAKKCFNFRSGNQWDEEARIALLEKLQMPITFNRIDPYVRAVAGLEAGNRQEIKFAPREVGDVSVNELYTEAVRWIRNNADAEFEESESFIDAVISGVGGTDTSMDYTEDAEGRVVIDHLDCLNEVSWDTDSKKKNLTDRKFDFRIKRDVPKSEIIAMFPEMEEEINALGDTSNWIDSEPEVEPWDRNPNTAYENGGLSGVKKKQKHTLVDYQWCERETYHKIINPITMAQEEVDHDTYLKHEQAARANGIDLIAENMATKPMKRKVWYRAFIVGDIVLEVDYCPCKTSGTRKFITGYRDRVRNMWYGMVRAMIDPQEWSNKFFSQILHIINTNSKGGLIAEQDAFVNPRKAIDDWSDPSGVVLLKQGGLAKVQERQPAAFPASIDRMMQFSIQAMGEVTGLPLELIGMVDRDQAGVLEAERKKTGITMLAALFDSFRYYHKEQGELLLYYVQEYMSDGRLIRIAGEGSEKYVPLVKQAETIKFDVIVDEMPQSTNNKERVWASMQVMLPILQNAGMPLEMLGDIIEYSPLPASFAERMKQTIQQNASQNAEAQQAIQQLQQQLQVVDGQAKEATGALQQKIAQTELALRDKSAEYQLKQGELILKNKELEIKEKEAMAKLIETEAKVQQTEVEIAKSLMEKPEQEKSIAIATPDPMKMSDAEKLLFDRETKLILKDKEQQHEKRMKLFDYRVSVEDEAADPLVEFDEALALKPANAAIEGINKLSEGIEEMKGELASVKQIVAAPRVTQLVTDENGKPTGSVSVPQLPQVEITSIQIEGSD